MNWEYFAAGYLCGVLYAYGYILRHLIFTAIRPPKWILTGGTFAALLWWVVIPWALFNTWRRKRHAK